jgi:flagellar P-ring protein precursor FlgI
MIRLLLLLLLAATAAAQNAPPAADAPAPAPAPATRPDAGPSPDARVGDLCTVEGVRSNHLTGLGLVVGLNGTGDGTDASRQVIAGLLRKFAINVTDRDVASANVAAVMVTAVLPAYARPGATLDVTLSSIGDCKSLFGGTLLLMELRGFDGATYAVAQGAVSVGGFSFGGQAATVQRNHPTVGRIPNGATVEREVPMRPVSDAGLLRLLLRDPSFTCAERVAGAVAALHPGTARALDSGTIQIALPAEAREPGGLPAFLSRVLALRVAPDTPARVVINERTGTLVAGEHVTIGPVAITHGNLTISVLEAPEASQPLPYTKGRTVVLPRTETEAREAKGEVQSFEAGLTLGSFAKGLNALGLTPRDLITILQALKEAGALRAEVFLQ